MLFRQPADAKLTAAPKIGVSLTCIVNTIRECALNGNAMQLQLTTDKADTHLLRIAGSVYVRFARSITVPLLE